MTDPRTAQLIAQVAERMLERVGPLLAAVDAAVFEAAPALAADATLAAESRASSHANVLRWLRSLKREPERPVPADVPPEALDIARSLVRRGAGLEVLLPAYRRGQGVAWRRWMAVAAEEVADRDELVAVLDAASARMFDYVDRTLEGIFEQVQREREELLGGVAARRVETVRLVLEGAPVPPERASARLGYELARRHTALVLWGEAGRSGALERAAGALARAVGAHRPLLVPAGTATLWAWLGTDGPPGGDATDAAMADVDPGVRVAMGPTLAGVAGFRRSHVAALAAQSLVAANPHGGPLVRYDDVEVVTLVSADEDRVREFVHRTLGSLAAASAAAARLRDTARTYLEEGGNAPRAARRLHTHRNTVLHRVRRAEALLGRSLDDRRLATALALECAHRLGPRLLAPAEDGAEPA